MKGENILNTMQKRSAKQTHICKLPEGPLFKTDREK